MWPNTPFVRFPEWMNLAVSHLAKFAHTYYSPCTQHVVPDRHSHRAASDPITFGTCLDASVDSSATSYVRVDRSIALQNLSVNLYNISPGDDCLPLPLIFPSLRHRLWFIFLKDSIPTALRKAALVTAILSTTVIYRSVPLVRAKRGSHSKMPWIALQVAP